VIESTPIADYITVYLRIGGIFYAHKETEESQNMPNAKIIALVNQKGGVTNGK